MIYGGIFMIRAMYAGISGLKVNQQKLDVVGNNIANVNTTAFKYQRMRFQNTLSQSVSQGTSPSNSIGGTNPVQIGLGAQVAGIDTVTTQGNLQPTSRNLDFAVDGTGYFVVGLGSNDSSIALNDPDADTNIITMDSANTTLSTIDYTRDGAFTTDNYGNLVTSDGYRVMGYALKNDTDAGPSVSHTNGEPTITYVNGDDKSLQRADDNKLVPLAIPKTVGTSMVKSISVDPNGVIKATLTNNTIAALGQIAMASFNNDAGLSNAGKNLLETTSNSGAAEFRTAVKSASDTGSISNDDAFGKVRQSMLEMSNVDLAEQFTDMIVASRAFQANGKIITTSDDILQELVNLKR
jgi:flagellar hook protein FlgE